MGKFKKGQTPWNKKPKVKLECRNCGDTFEVHPCRKETAKYCNNECFKNHLKIRYKGNGHPQWKGGKQKTGNGYIQILKPGHHEADDRGRVLEHRYVMEQKLSRKLKDGEVVHHKNGKRDDNRPENLKLYKSNGKHLSDEMKEISKGYKRENGRFVARD